MAGGDGRAATGPASAARQRCGDTRRRGGSSGGARGDKVEERGGGLDGLRVLLVADAEVEKQHDDAREDLVADARAEKLARLVVRGHAVLEKRRQLAVRAGHVGGAALERLERRTVRGALCRRSVSNARR